MRRIIFVFGIILSGLFSVVQAQSLVKMSVPKQSDKPLQIVVLFEGGLSGNVSIVLGVDYEVIGGVAPYSFEWLQNGEVVGTSDIVVVNPKNGDRIDLYVRDAIRCFTSASFNLGTSTQISSEDGKGTAEIRIYPTLVKDGVIHITLPESDDPAQALIRIFDMKGDLCYQQTAAESLNIQMNLQSGMYLVVVTTKGKYVVEKVVVE